MSGLGAYGSLDRSLATGPASTFVDTLVRRFRRQQSHRPANSVSSAMAPMTTPTMRPTSAELDVEPPEVGIDEPVAGPLVALPVTVMTV